MNGGLTNSVTGFALSTGFALGTGAEIGEALRQGGQSALMGLGIGVIGGAVKGFEDARKDNVGPWDGIPIQKHHSDPKYMGGDVNQKLTPMSRSLHQELHKEMNEYMRGQTDAAGNHMRPQRGNPAYKIQQNFERPLRLDALKGFYDSHRLKYWNVRYDFYKNNGMKWRP